MVTIRPAVWDDRHAIARLIAAMGSHEDVLDAPDPLLRLGQLISDPNARALVAVEEGKVVGYADLLARASSLHDRVEGWLGALAVDSSMRRSGIGSNLMAAIEREASILGCDYIVLESSSRREAAHAFYRSIGFEQLTAADRFQRPQPTAGDEVSMFLFAAARAANRVRSVLAPWVGVATDDKVADLAAEAAALEVLGELHVPILSEEGGWAGTHRDGGSWICLDPVDGSRNLRAGLPPWAFSAALVREGEAVAGFVCNLASGRRWWARRGGGALVDGRPARSRRIGLVGVGSRPDVVGPLPGWVERTRILGSSAVELCCVADGSLGGFVGLGQVTLHAQDVAAASVIIAEAGGVVVDASGRELTIQPDRDALLQLVASSDVERAHDLLAGYRDVVANGLEMRPKCERCDRTLEAGSVAFICSYECTFCEDCSKEMHAVCPNCGGELVRRPRRVTED